MENFDIDFSTTATVSDSVTKYFVKVVAPMIPKIFSYRIGHDIGLSDVDVKYAGTCFLLSPGLPVNRFI